MQQSKSKLSFFKASVAASVIIVLLALTVPLVGLLMIPVVVLRTVTRAVRSRASELGLLKNRWAAIAAKSRRAGAGAVDPVTG